jgi:hypothetical protein
MGRDNTPGIELAQIGRPPDPNRAIARRLLAHCKRLQRGKGGLLVLHRSRQSLRRFLLFKQPMNGLLNVLWQPEQVKDASNADAFVMNAGCGMRDTPAPREDCCLWEYG